MISIRRLASALFLAICFSSLSKAQTAADLDPSQTYNTGNIVVPTTTTSGSTWTNGVYQDSLTCWGWGDPGYCGPNPIVRPGGNINFSYGWTDLYQQQQIAAVLPYSGTGLRVDGYNFGFTAKNGNGWDDGRTDLLYAYVQFDGPNGTVLNNTTNLSYQFNWTTFNLNQTFAAPYSTEEITSVRYGFVGRDNNFWAGPYGPEIADVSFSLRYSVDPCAINILSSPSCEGYLEYIAGLSVTPAVDTAGSSIIVANESATTPDSTTTAAPTVQQTLLLDNQTSPAATSISSASDSQSSGNSRVSLSTILNIIGNEQTRISNVERSTVESSVEQSVKEADRATQQAEAIASFAVTDSITASISSAHTQMIIDQQQANQSSGGGLNVFSSTTLSISLSDSSVGFKAPEPVFEQIETTIRAENLSENLVSLSVPYSVGVAREETSMTNIEEKIDSAVSFSGFSAVNVLEEERSKLDSESQTDQTASTVNQTAANNELAGGVTLASLGSVPQGFNAYSASMPDSSFYAPREIYRNQKTVDNPAGRRLFGATDRLHQEMVDQQYNQGAQ